MRHDNRGRGSGGYQQDRPRTNYAAMTEYYDAEGKLKKEVFVEWPKAIADHLKQNKESRTSLRRFFSQLAAVRYQHRMLPNDKTLIRHGVGRLHTFAQYQAGRVIKDDTKNFIVVNCNKVLGDESQFEGFFQLFQGVMAYLPRNQ